MTVYIAEDPEVIKMGVRGFVLFEIVVKKRDGNVYSTNIVMTGVLIGTGLLPLEKNKIEN